jgi:hypothetical protein
MLTEAGKEKVCPNPRSGWKNSFSNNPRTGREKVCPNP